MADDFKTLVALTKETNAKLELLHKQGDDNDSPRERILDALPEILAAKDISKKETDQKDKLHREEIKKNKNNLEELKKADAERSKESTKNSQSIKQQNQMIVSEGHKDTAIIVDSLGNVEKSQSINQKIQLRLNEKPEPAGSADEEDSNKQKSFFEKLIKVGEATNKKLGFLDKISGGIERGGKSLFSKILKAGLIGGMILLVNFLSGPYFDKFYDTVVNTLIPAFVKVYEILKPIVKAVGGALLNLLKDIGGLFGAGEVDELGYRTGPKTLFDVLMDNKLTILGIIAALAPFKILKGILKLPFLLGTAFMLIGKAGLGLVNGFRGAAGAAPLKPNALSGGAPLGGGASKGPVGKVDGRNVARSAKGKLAFAGADGKATTELLNKDQQTRMKATKPIGSGRLMKAFKLFPNLLRAGRAFAPLGLILGGVDATRVLLSDMSNDQKGEELGRVLGGTLGGIGFAALGAIIGSVVPGLGTAFGGLLGGVVGAYGGDYAGRIVADLLMGNESKELNFIKSLGITKTLMSLGTKLFGSSESNSMGAITGQAQGANPQTSGGFGVNISPAVRRIQGGGNPQLTGGFGGPQGGGASAIINAPVVNNTNNSQGLVGAPVPLQDFSHFGQLAYHGYPNN